MWLKIAFRSLIGEAPDPAGSHATQLTRRVPGGTFLVAHYGQGFVI
jgi:hypothetical protein